MPPSNWPAGGSPPTYWASLPLGSPPRSPGKGRWRGPAPGVDSPSRGVAAGESRVVAEAERDPRVGGENKAPSCQQRKEAPAPEQVSQVHLKRYRPGARGRPRPWRGPSPAGAGLAPPAAGNCSRRRLSQRDRGSPSPARTCAGVGAAAPGVLPPRSRSRRLLGPQRRTPRERGGSRGCHAGRSRQDGLGVRAEAAQDRDTRRRRRSGFAGAHQQRTDLETPELGRRGCEPGALAGLRAPGQTRKCGAPASAAG